jgi:hypothetical protein
MKHPTNTNNGAVALRNEFSGLYLSAQSKTHGENGESLEAPICSVNVVLDPYDENGCIRSSCAFTFENNCLRNCDGIFLGIEEMTQEGAAALCLQHVFLISRQFRRTRKNHSLFTCRIHDQRLKRQRARQRVKQLQCIFPIHLIFLK